MASKLNVIKRRIASLDEPWCDLANNTAHDLEDIEAFLKEQLSNIGHKKLGYVAVEMIEDAPILMAFADKECYLQYKESPVDNEALVLASVALPSAGKQTENSYSVALKRNGSGNIATTDGSGIVQLRFSSMERTPDGVRSHFDEDGVLTIERRADDSQAWAKCATETLRSVADDSSDYTAIDVAKYLPQGTWQIRMRVKSQTSELNTGYVSLTVSKVTLSLAFCNSWQIPVRGNVLPLNYTYTGAVNKTLHLRISGQGGTREISYPLGMGVYAESPRTFEIADASSDAVKVLTHGIHNVEAWLSVDGSTSESKHIKSQVLVIADETATTPFVIVNNVVGGFNAWTEVDMFDYAVYSPDGSGVSLNFLLKDANTQAAFLEINEKNIPSGEIRTFSNVVETESDKTKIASVMCITGADGALSSNISFVIDNPPGFAPVKDADFILNPKTRTNREASPASIINGKDNSLVTATFEGFGFISDGWVMDANGVRCLHIPAGRRLTIDYKALSDFVGDSTTAKHGSLCFDVDFAVRSITDESEPILRMCTYDTDGTPLGLELLPMEGVMMTQSNRDRDNQGFGWAEESRTHLSMALVFNAAQSGVNYCRTYINGVINKEFAYDTKAVFVSGNNVPNIVLGSSGADVDIYSIRVYRKELSSRHIEQNHLASLPTTAEKIAFKEANDILTDGIIDYEKASRKFNTLKWIGTYAKYGNEKKDTFPGTLVVHQPGLPQYSGTITGLVESGQGTSSMLYHTWNARWKFASETEGEWTDEDGNVKGQYFQLGDGLPKAKVNDGKVNFASSMQSHKMGACNLFNDLYKAILGTSGVTATTGYEDCRFAVNQKPFLLFVQDDENSAPRFLSLMTFGPSKSDTVTFGYDTAVFPDHIAIEGADNDKPLIMGRVPWIDDDVILVKGEDWTYKGGPQFSLIKGDLSKASYFKDAFQFIYRTYFDIAPYTGTLADLRADVSVNTNKHYWLTEESSDNAVYDLCRYDYLTKQWVHAGMDKTAPGVYSRFNINEQCGNIVNAEGGYVWADVNAQFKAKRLEMFKTGIGNYFKVDAILFLMCFLKLTAASDNWGKNWYLFVDPESKKISFYNDDLDTIFCTDNVGKMKKPYDVEEHDKVANSPYWNSETNSLFNSMEGAYDTELRAMMTTMLTNMASLGGSPLACMDKYFMSTQRYFPACAYNETARVVYERAYVAQMNGTYSNGTNALTQSNGNSLERERQWIERRIAYLSSWAQYGEFGCKDGGQSAGSLNFRSVVKRNGNKCTYAFTITPRISMYPSFAKGQTLSRGTFNDKPQRVKANTAFVGHLGESDGNTNMFINGVNHLYSVGNFAPVALDSSFTLTGKNLREFVVDGEATPEFRPSTMAVTAPNLRTLTVRNVAELGGAMDLSKQVKLRSIDLRGTSISSITLPPSEELTSVQLPATLKALVVTDQPNISTLVLDGAEALETLIIPGSLSSSLAIAEKAATAKAPLNSCTLEGVNWTNVKTSTVLYLAKLKKKLGDRFKVSGTVKVAAGQTMTLANLQEVSAAFGVFDSADPAQTLAVDYSNCYVRLTDFRISQAGDYFEAPGQRTLTPILTPTNANMIRSVEWSIDNDTCATIDPATGLLNVLRVDSDLKPTATVSCTITLLHGTTMTRTVTLHFFPKEPMKIFDPVYHDGSYGLGNGDGKTLIGICFDVIDMQDRTKRRKIFALKDIGKSQWGPADNLKDSTGGVIMPADVPYIPNKGIANSTQSPESMWDSEAEIWKTQPFGTASADIGDIYLADSEEMATIGETYRRTTVYDNDTTIAEPGATDTVPAGSVMTAGQYYQRKLIQDRNRLMRLFGKQIPAAQYLRTEWEDMSIKHNDNYYKSQGYGAFSLCYAYEPVLSDVNHITELIPEARVHNWYLPTAGELMQISCCLTMISQAVEGDKLWPIRQMLTQGILTGMTANTWSSSEYYSGCAWYCASGWTGYGIKGNEFAVRPVAAF